jgi:pimeloyl-ACP methyl ester carboxylesterase
MRRFSNSFRIAVATSIVAGVTASGPLPAHAGPISEPDFYTNVPADLTRYAPGDVIHWEAETDLGPKLVNLTAYRVMYRSDGYTGDPVAEVTMVFIPNGAPPAGGWPIVAWGHGTSGIGDSCAPSKYPSLYADPWPQYGNEIARLVQQGYVVTAPDYEGLGTPGLHSYLNTDAEGIAVIDAVRAARHIAIDVVGTTVGTKWAVVGHSQGGQAAIGAAELAAARAPGLQMVGAVALAPPARLFAFQAEMAADPLFFPYIGYMAAGIGATHPGFDYANFLGPQLLPYAAYAEEWCFDTWFPAIGTYLKPGVHRNLANGWSSDPDVRDYFADARIGTRVAGAPLLYLQGTADLLHVESRRQVQELCAVGDVVQYSEYPGLEHDPIVWKGWPETKNWLVDRFAGVPAPNDC